MPAAFTLYKFKKLFGLVLVILFGTAIFSQVYPIIKDAKNEVLESAGMNKSNVPKDPVKTTKASVKSSIGQKMWHLLEEKPLKFVGLVLFITVVLFLGGVYLRHVRAFSRFF